MDLETYRKLCHRVATDAPEWARSVYRAGPDASPKMCEPYWSIFAEVIRERGAGMIGDFIGGGAIFATLIVALWIVGGAGL